MQPRYQPLEPCVVSRCRCKEHWFSFHVGERRPGFWIHAIRGETSISSVRCVLFAGGCQGLKSGCLFLLRLPVFVWMRASPTGVVVLRLMLPRSSASNETDRSDPGQSSSKRLAVNSEAGLKGKRTCLKTSKSQTYVEHVSVLTHPFPNPTALPTFACGAAGLETQLCDPRVSGRGRGGVFLATPRRLQGLAPVGLDF